MSSPDNGTGPPVRVRGSHSGAACDGRFSSTTLRRVATLSLWGLYLDEDLPLFHPPGESGDGGVEEGEVDDAHGWGEAFDGEGVHGTEEEGLEDVDEEGVHAEGGKGWDLEAYFVADEIEGEEGEEAEAGGPKGEGRGHVVGGVGPFGFGRAPRDVDEVARQAEAYPPRQAADDEFLFVARGEEIVGEGAEE